MLIVYSFFLLKTINWISKSFLFMLFSNSLLYLLCVFVLILDIILVTALVRALVGFSTLENFLVLFVHFFNFFLLILSSHFFPPTLDVLDIGRYFGVLSHFSELTAMIFFCQELTLLIFIKPGNGFNVDVELSKWGDASA